MGVARLSGKTEAATERAPLVSIVLERKTFFARDRSQLVLDRIEFSLPAGEFVSVVGPSGCGKTTLLRCIAGLDTDYEGSIHVAGRLVRGPGLDRGVVFQEPRLFPWMAVEENVAFAGDRNTQRSRVKELLSLVGLSNAEQRWPKQLSGGMAQRVALARALVNLPQLLLLDEPFGALDNFTRARMQAELHQILQREGVTALLVTHDIDEALILSDRVLVMASDPGRIARTIEVKTDRPRDRNDVAFIALRAEIEGILSTKDG